MELSFSEKAFVETVSSDIFDNCISEYGEFDPVIFEEVLSNEKDEEVKLIIKTISQFCFLCMTDQPNNPFKPYYCVDNTRSFMIEDISKDLAKLIYTHIDDIQNEAIKTRLCDCLWIAKLLDKKDNIVCAKKAVYGYYNMIDTFINNGNLYAATKYTKRVFDLAMSLSNTPERSAVFDNMLKYSSIEYVDDININCMFFYQLLYQASQFNIKDPEVATIFYYKTTELIKKILKDKFYLFPNNATYGSEKMQEISYDLSDVNFDWLHKFYDLAISFALKTDKDQSELIYSKAKSYECEAQLKSESNIFSSLLKEAIRTYRTVPGHKADINRLTKIVEQTTCSLPYAIFSHNTDISKIVKNAQESVAGKDFNNAVFSFVLLFEELIGAFLNKDKAKENALKMQQLSPFVSLVPRIIVDSYGHEICTYSTDEELLEFKMLENLWIGNDMCYTPIREAIKIINMEHKYTYTDILNLMYNTPFVPNDHKAMIAKGIYYFLQNDMMEAGHFLILQFEDCLRFLLEPKEITIKIKDNASEENYTNIKSLLDKCVENKIFPEGLAWFFESYLVVKAKSVRHNIAHGKLHDNNYYSTDITILCYGIIYLVLYHNAKHFFENLSKS